MLGGVNSPLTNDISDFNVVFSDDKDISSYNDVDEILDEINTGSQCSKLFSKVKNGLKYLSYTISNAWDNIISLNNRFAKGAMLVNSGSLTEFTFILPFALTGTYTYGLLLCGYEDPTKISAIPILVCINGILINSNCNYTGVTLIPTINSATSITFTCSSTMWGGMRFLYFDA